MSNTSETSNVMQLNTVIDRVSTTMDALNETAEDTGVYVDAADLDHLERALSEFFTDRDAREPASAVLTGGV